MYGFWFSIGYVIGISSLVDCGFCGIWYVVGISSLVDWMLVLGVGVIKYDVYSLC